MAEIELCLQDAGYKYKYEKVENFRAYRVEEKIYVNMVKNGEEKQYVFKDTNFASNYHEMLNTIASENE